MVCHQDHYKEKTMALTAEVQGEGRREIPHERFLETFSVKGEGKVLGRMGGNAISYGKREEMENDVQDVIGVAATTAETLAMVHQCQREMRTDRHDEMTVEIVEDSTCLRQPSEI